MRAREAIRLHNGDQVLTKAPDGTWQPGIVLHVQACDTLRDINVVVIDYTGHYRQLHHREVR